MIHIKSLASAGGDSNVLLTVALLMLIFLLCSVPLEEVHPAGGIQAAAAVSLHELESCCQGNDQLTKPSRSPDEPKGKPPQIKMKSIIWTQNLKFLLNSRRSALWKQVLFAFTDPVVCEDVVGEEEISSSTAFLQTPRESPDVHVHDNRSDRRFGLSFVFCHVFEGKINPTVSPERSNICVTPRTIFTGLTR